MMGLRKEEYIEKYKNKKHYHNYQVNVTLLRFIGMRGCSYDCHSFFAGEAYLGFQNIFDIWYCR